MLPREAIKRSVAIGPGIMPSYRGLGEKKLNEVARKGRSGRYVSTYRITTRLPVAGPKAANPGDSTG